MIEDNSPSVFRKQHGNFDLLCDIIHKQGIIDDGMHKDCMFYLQMRDSFNAKSAGKDTMLGRMVDDAAMASDGGNGSSLTEKYFTLLRELNTTTQTVMTLLVSPAPSPAKSLWGSKRLIHDAINDFCEWAKKGSASV